MNDDESIKVNVHKNDIDIIYLELLSVIGDSMDRVEIKDLKRDINEKYRFFQKIPMTIVFFGPHLSGKTSLLINTLNIIRDKGKSNIDLSFICELQHVKSKLVIYENSDDFYFHLVRKKDHHIVKTDKCTDNSTLINLIQNFNLETIDFDELIFKLPHLSIQIQMLDTPLLSEITVTQIKSYLVNTSIPIFVYVSSIVFEVKLNDNYFELMRTFISKFEDCYFYMIFTKIDLLEYNINKYLEDQIDLFAFNLKCFLDNIEKINLKLIGLSLVSNKIKEDNQLFSKYIHFLKDFNYTNLAVMRLDYFKCLLKSCINKFSLSVSKKKISNVSEADTLKFKNENYKKVFDYKLAKFFEILPKNIDEVKKNYLGWFNILMKNLKENYEKTLKNNNYFNRKSFMKDHIELIKPCFESLLKDHIKILIGQIILKSTFPDDIQNLCSEALQKVKTSYKLGSYLGIWTKEGVYEDIIMKLFKRIRENWSIVTTNCVKFFESTINLMAKHLENSRKISDLVQNFLKVVESYEHSKTKIIVYNTRVLLTEYLNTKRDDFSVRLSQIVKNINT